MHALKVLAVRAVRRPSFEHEFTGYGAVAPEPRAAMTACASERVERAERSERLGIVEKQDGEIRVAHDALPGPPYQPEAPARVRANESTV
jgi:hypothetical protein